MSDRKIDSTAASTGGERGGVIAESPEAEPTPGQHPDTPSSGDAAAEPKTDRPLPLDSILDVLSNQRRRYVIAYLSREGPAVTIPALTDSLARFETADPEGEVTAQERKRVYVALYQCHLTLLDTHDVVEFNKADSEVVVGRNFHVVYRSLTALQDVTDGSASPTSSAGYFSLVLWTALTAGGISVFASSLVVSGLPISGIGVAVLSALVTWAGISLYVRIRSDGH